MSTLPDALSPVAVLPESPPYGSVATLLAHFGRDELLQLAPARAEEGPELVEGQEEALDEALLLRALRRASREADSYLATRYKVPLTPAQGEDGAPLWPEPLTGFVADMAHYHLCGGNARDDEGIMRRYQEALDWLKVVAKGLADLPPPPDSGAGEDGEGETTDGVAFVQCRRQNEWR